MVFESIHTLRGTRSHGGGVAFSQEWELGKRSSQLLKRLRVAGAFAFFAGVSIRGILRTIWRKGQHSRVKSHHFQHCEVAKRISVCSWGEFSFSQSTRSKPSLLSMVCRLLVCGRIWRFLSDCVVAAFWLTFVKEISNRNRLGIHGYLRAFRSGRRESCSNNFFALLSMSAHPHGFPRTLDCLSF